MLHLKVLQNQQKKIFFQFRSEKLKTKFAPAKKLFRELGETILNISYFNVYYASNSILHLIWAFSIDFYVSSTSFLIWIYYFIIYVFRSVVDNLYCFLIFFQQISDHYFKGLIYSCWNKYYNYSLNVKWIYLSL